MKSIIKIVLLAMIIGLCWAEGQTVADSAKADSLEKDSTKVSVQKSSRKSDDDTKYDYFIDRNGDGIDDRLDSKNTYIKKTSVKKESSKKKISKKKKSRSSSSSHRKNTSTTKSTRYRGK